MSNETTTQQPAPATKFALKLCKTCQHVRKRAPIALFGQHDLQSPGVLKAQIEWDQERKQRAQLELSRAQSQQPFDYEPYNYEWCAKFTNIELVEKAQAGDSAALEQLMAEGGASMNPVSGDITPLYILCAWKNSDGQCPKHEPR